MTIFDQLNRLPIPYRDLALNNMEKELCDVECDFVSVALVMAFVWGQSPEGHEFWERVYYWVHYYMDGVKSIYPLDLPPIPEDV